ncbi:MAG TPA: nuclear transport factor 2 family protein [Candidatus Binataceae bacterium]|jgi:ketosteroid isomerase-like protein|nr:nuclear transport factor 2 family protein [Candidatus Binataceae bacterium]
MRNISNRSLIIGIALSIALIAFTQGPRAYAAASAKDQISDVEHKLIAATSADEAIKYYDATDADVFDFSGPPLEYQGTDAVHTDFNNFFSNAKDVKGEFKELVIVTDGRMGMARSLQHFTWTGKDGKPAEALIRVTDVLKKEPTGWKIIHSHISVPVDPKTGQGLLNLKPGQGA